MEIKDSVGYRFHQKSLRKLPEVLTLYYGYNLTIKEISKALNMHHVVVSRLLKVYGRGLRKNKTHYPNE